MSASGAGYDLSTTTYSPDGRVFQVEYAAKAVEMGGLSIGIRCKDGVVLGVEKAIHNKMIVPGTNRRIFTVDEHAGLAVAGLAADGRKLANVARGECRDYRSFYGSPIPGHVLNSRLAGSVHSATLYWYMRPYGTAVLVAAYEEKPELYMVEPSGLGFRYFAIAIGKSKQGANTELEKLDADNITAREAVLEIARIIYKLHDEVKDKEFELELSWVCDESKRRHVAVPEDLKAEAIQRAIAEHADDMDDSDDEQ